MVKDIKVDTEGTGVFYCVKKSEGTTKSGSPYLSLVMQDASGRIDCKIWNSTGVSVEEGKVYRASYKAGEFNGVTQLVLTAPVVIEDADVTDFCVKSPLDIEGMWNALKNTLESVEDEYLARLIQSYLTDEEFVKAFKSHSAAEEVHHAFVGGLLQHSLFVVTICDSVAKVYKGVNRDLLVTTAFLHDVGKLEELSAFPDNKYTESGYLVGHVVLSTMDAVKRCESIEGFPAVLRDNIAHCLLAHHDKLEYGSPKRPALLEAVILSHVDKLDADVEIFKEQLEKNDSFNKYLQSTCLQTKR